MSSYKCCQANATENKSIIAQSSLLKLIAEESRLKLLCILRSGSHCVSELLEHVNLSQSLTSHHLADLRKAGIVTEKKEGRQVYYSLSPKGEHVIELLTSLTSKEKI